MNRVTWIRLALLAAALGSVAGCATTADLDGLRDELAAIRTSVNEAQQDATAAGESAQGAQQSADAARETADQALRLAEETQSCCNRNTRRMDRMFEQSVLK